MEYTEEVKKEAEEIVGNIIAKTKESLGSMVFSDFGYNHLGTILAIQDRQSVLDYLNNAYLSNKIDVLDTDVLNNLTQQITYLKQNI